MNTITVTIGQVEAAFERLLAVVGRECGDDTARTVHFAGVDVLAILRGDWPDGESGADRSPRITNDELRMTNEEDGTEAGRCPRCNQSLGDIGRSMFACPGCYEAFGDEAIEAALPF